ncbi:hypothetical protein [Fulvivirga sediminis]|uniref:Uncharacterized protein n=1 Tax=Fulvivirga sediminis TaxID=2803949 RepID=A0A937FCK8_9BACT|nr:hypothetical protein [Fulvivirga sediminis]MBL3658425.1 hypothetical protein [Fulvivirga sediminis]
MKPPFETQGEQEDYWAQELFRKEYKKQEYPRFDGTITTTNNRINFGTGSIIFLDQNSNCQQIFEQGFLYPSLFGLTELKIGDLEELDFLSNNPTVKRFRFIHYDRTLMNVKLANPQVYLFELENPNWQNDGTFDDFLKDAKLTFLKAGWIMI